MQDLHGISILLFEEPACTPAILGMAVSLGASIHHANLGTKLPTPTDADLAVFCVHTGQASSAAAAAHALRAAQADLPCLFIIDENALDALDLLEEMPLAQLVSAASGPSFQISAARSALGLAALHRTQIADEARWRTALEGSQLGAWEWNAQTNETYFSPQWKAMLGYSEGEIQSDLSEWQSRVHPDDLAEALAAVQRHLDGETPAYHSEHRLRCKDGSYKWILDSGKVMERAADGSPLRLAGTHRDITERKEAEIERDRMAARFKTLYKQSPIGIEIYDAAGRMVDQNVVCLELFGVVDPAEVRGFSLFDDPNVPAAMRDALRGGATVSFQSVFNFDHVKARKLYRTHRSGEIWLELVLSALKDEDGSINGYMAQVIDISDRKKMEEQMLRESRHYAMLMHTSRDAIHVLDADGNLVDWNEAFLNHLGVTTEEAAQMKVSDWDRQWSMEELKDKIQALVHSPATFETRHRRKDGTILDVEITAAGFEQNGQTYLYASGRDITKRKRAEEDLRASEGRFRSVFERSQAVKLMVDAQSGAILDANAAAAEFYGWPIDRLRRMNINEINTLPTEMLQIERLSAAEGRKNFFIFHHRIASGELRTVEVHSTPIDIQGSLVLFLIIHDVTEREKIQADLRESEERFYAFFHDHSAAMLQVDTENWIILEANSAAEIFYGYAHKAMTGIPIEQINRLPMSYTAHILDQIKGHQRKSIKAIHHTAQGAERTVEISASPIALRKRIVSFEIITDITEREQMQASLHESEERFHSMFLNHSAVMLQIDPVNWTILDANYAAESYYGYTRFELLAMPVAQINQRPPEFFAQVTQQVVKGLLDGPIRSMHRLASGEIRQVEIYPSPIEVRGKVIFFEIIHDVTEREQIQTALRESEERFRALFDQTNDAVFFLDMQGRHKFANHRAAEMLGYSFDEILALSVREVSAQGPSSQRVMEQLTAGEKVPVYERLFRKKNGQVFPVEINVQLVKDAQGCPVHYQSVVRDITQRKADEDALRQAHKQLGEHMAEVERLQNELRDQAIRDPLTGLFNRRYLSEMLTREIDRALRENSSLSVIVADIDHFKVVNDTYGHMIGDQFLVEYAQLIRKCTRGSDVVCRYGGEEFLLLLPGSNIAAAEKRAEEICEKCKNFTIQHETGAINSTISMGIATFPEHGWTSDELIQKADRALYNAKQSGRNRVCVWGKTS